MSDFFAVIIMGVVQGLTEFIPISSSGHLVVVRELLGIADPGIAVDVILHLGTLLAIFIFFWREYFIANYRIWLYLVIGTVPVAIVGLLAKSFIEENVRSGLVVASLLVGVGAIMLLTEILVRYKIIKLQPGDNWRKSLSPLKVLLIGCLQVLALFPGVSRSGITILGGMYVGLSRKDAAKFSFLLGGIAIAAAGIMGIVDLTQAETLAVSWLNLLVGFIVSFVVGWLAIKFLMKYLEKRGLIVFAIYLLVVGGILFII